MAAEHAKGQEEVRLFEFFNLATEVAKVKLSKDPNDFGAYVDDVGPDEPTELIDISQIKYVFEPDELHQTKPGAPEKIEKMVQDIKNGDSLPPVLVRKFKNGYQILDGHHRFKAYRIAKVKKIPVRIVDPENITGDLEESKQQPDPKKIQSGIFDLENKLKAIAGDKLTYKDIEAIIQSIAKNNSITQQDLESFFKRKHGVQPYEWLAYLPTPRRPIH